MKRRGTFQWYEYLIFLLVTLFIFLLCLGVGSVQYPLDTTARVLLNGLTRTPQEGAAVSILLRVRLPRVLCVALIGAMLALGGAAMQGLLRNPLADGSTLGVSSGASLGAAVALLFGGAAMPAGGTAAVAMLFAFLSMVFLLSLAFALDHTLQTHTILLLGVVFSMFVSSLLSLLVTFAGEKLRTITFWTMGNLASASFSNAAMLAAVLAVCGGVLLCHGRALNALALGEEQALHLGVNVRRVKLTVMVTVCAMIGASVSVGGGIGFVGLVTPHMLRMLVGPNHRRLLPASVFGGACFLLLADLAARTVLSPIQLPVGVVTSLIGAAAFVVIFVRTGRGKAA